MNAPKINPVLLFLLFVGAILRFYGFPDIPFTYDELSAWGRTDYSSFSQLIDEGVRGDGHPALIQVFLYYWRKVFGDSEASFKLPFLLMGLACIYLIFLIGKKWFNETTGILCAAFFTVLQYTVMYSQIARPYISGLFLSLMMVNSWTNFLFGKEPRSKKSLLGFVIFASLCCYNHYFSLLFALIVGFSGYFFLKKKEWKQYSLGGLIVLVLFIPHIGVTIDQMKIGGVGGWLAKPDQHFFGKYLSYIFDFSWWVKGLVVLLVVVSFIKISEDWQQKIKMQILCFAWFVLPIAIGYFYSRYKNPVLQYSVLIFSFPYLLLLLFSFFRNQKLLVQLALSLTIVSVGIYGLVFQRQHYKIFYKQPVEQMVKLSDEFAKSHPGKKLLVVIQEPWKYMNYYLDKWNSKVTIRSFQDSVFQEYQSTLQNVREENPDYVLCGNIPYPHLELYRNSYPKIIEAQKGFTYDFFVLARSGDPGASLPEIRLEDSLNFLNPDTSWHCDTNLVRVDTVSGKIFYHMDPSQEYSPGFSTTLDSIMQSRQDYLVLDVEVQNANPTSDASLVLSFGDRDIMLFWQEKPFKIFVDSSGQGHLVNAIHFRDFDFTRNNPRFSFYLWNRNHESFDILSMKFLVMKGNPLIYSLIEPIRKYE